MARAQVLVPYYVLHTNSVTGEVMQKLGEQLRHRMLSHLKQQKLVSGSLSYMPSMRDDTLSFQKALKRIRSILEREVFKAAPYLKHLASYTQGGDLVSVEPAYGELTLSGIILCTEDSRLPRILSRYCRYLTYLSRKSHLPFSVCTVYQPLPEPLPQEPIHEGARLARSLQVRLRMSPSIPLSQETGVRMSYAELDALRDVLASRGEDPDRVYRVSDDADTDIVFWDLADSYGRITRASAFRPLYPEDPIGPWTPELVAFYIREIVKCMVTLSRKLSYVASAFTIGTPENL